MATPSPVWPFVAALRKIGVSSQVLMVIFDLLQVARNPGESLQLRYFRKLTTQYHMRLAQALLSHYIAHQR